MANDAANDAAEELAANASSFCAQFDGGAACADFDDSTLPYGLSFRRVTQGDTSASSIIPPEPSHPSPALAASAEADRDASSSNANEAIISVTDMPFSPSGMHVEADFRVGQMGPAGTVLQIYGNADTTLVFGAYTHFEGGDLEERLFDHDYQSIGGGTLIGSLGAAGWAHIDVDIIPMGASTVLKASTTVNGVLGPTVTQQVPQQFTSVTVGAGSFPDSISSGTFSVKLDNVLVRPL